MICQDCRLPVLACAACFELNQAFARFCRHCRMDLLSGAHNCFSRSTLQDKPITTSIPELCLAPPVSAFGHFWLLSERGNVWRVTHGRLEPVLVARLDPSYARGAFAVRRIPSPTSGTAGGPYLLAASPNSVSSVNLLTGDVSITPVGGEGLRILCDTQSDGCVALETDERHIYCLVRDEKGVHLRTQDHLDPDRSTLLALPEENVSGPLRVGDRVAVYTPRHILFPDALNAGSDGRVSLPPGYVPLRRATDDCRMTLHARGLGWFTGGDYTYLFGTRARDHQPTMLGVHQDAGRVAVVPIAVQEGASCAASAGGSPVLVEADQIVWYDGLRRRVAVKHDADVADDAPAFYCGTLTSAVVDLRAGRVALRLYRGEHQFDYSLDETRDWVHFLGFAETPTALAFAYLALKARATVLCLWCAA
jgi:hypothetical protein